MYSKKDFNVILNEKHLYKETLMQIVNIIPLTETKKNIEGILLVSNISTIPRSIQNILCLEKQVWELGGHRHEVCSVVVL